MWPLMKSTSICSNLFYGLSGLVKQLCHEWFDRRLLHLVKHLSPVSPGK